jgi:hypothetical protein
VSCGPCGVSRTRYYADETQVNPRPSEECRLPDGRVSQRPERSNAVAAVAAFAGAAVILLGSSLHYASGCETCRVIAPPGVSLAVWLPSAVEPLLAVALGLVLGMILVLAGGGRFLAGLLVGVGLLAIARFFLYAVLVRAPVGGTFGLGGIVGMIGGALILAAGLLAKQSGRP